MGPLGGYISRGYLLRASVGHPRWANTLSSRSIRSTGMPDRPRPLLTLMTVRFASCLRGLLVLTRSTGDKKQRILSSRSHWPRSIRHAPAPPPPPSPPTLMATTAVASLDSDDGASFTCHFKPISPPPPPPSPTPFSRLVYLWGRAARRTGSFTRAPRTTWPPSTPTMPRGPQRCPPCLFLPPPPDAGLFRGSLCCMCACPGACWPWPPSRRQLFIILCTDCRAAAGNALALV